MIKNKFKQTEIGRIPEDWEEKRLGDEIELCYGKGLTENKRIFGKFPVFGSNGVVGFHNQFLVQGPGIIIGRKGSVGEIKFSKNNFWPIDTTYFVKLKKEGNIYFWYYLLLTLKLNKMNSHSAVPGLNREQVYDILKEIPDIEEQSAIASILSSLDSKIELNQQMNATLEAIGQALFKQWFVDFEFPNEEGKPYKSSGGEMVETELGEIPKGWRVGTLEDIIVNFDSMRIPLSSRERASRKELYPYYGAASIMDYIDEYIFDEIYVLMGEDGTVIDENEHPILQYVWGKFWVNNHAHVIQGKEGIPTEYILLLLKQTNVKHIVTGAVQPKINQANMNSLTVIIPPKDTLSSFSELITPVFEKYRMNYEEIKSLSQIRDSLLPKLMSGEIRAKY